MRCMRRNIALLMMIYQLSRRTCGKDFLKRKARSIAGLRTLKRRLMVKTMKAVHRMHKVTETQVHNIAGLDLVEVGMVDRVVIMAAMTLILMFSAMTLRVSS